MRKNKAKENNHGKLYINNIFSNYSLNAYNEET